MTDNREPAPMTAKEAHTMLKVAEWWRDVCGAKGIAALHAELSWIGETALRRRAGMESRPGPKPEFVRKSDEPPVPGADSIELLTTKGPTDD